MSRPKGTLVRPPRIDPSRSQIENVLELTPLNDIGPDVFTNTRPLWHPPGARGIYGGAAIAMCLAAAQRTVAAGFWVHSMHCYFVLAGDSAIPVLYHVERVREGRSFATRTVQARQRGRCIFTTTLSFVREGSAGTDVVGHEALPPDGAGEWLDQVLGSEAAARREARRKENGAAAAGTVEEIAKGAEDIADSPFVSRRMDTVGAGIGDIAAKQTKQWVRCRGTISKAAGQQMHLCALAYMSDSYFIGTVARVHNLWRFGRPSRSESGESAAPPTQTKRSVSPSSRITTTAPSLRSSSSSSSSAAATLPPPKTPTAHPLAAIEARENAGSDAPPRAIGMMVSLDHSIYFHNPRAVRADEWLFAQMESPWAGDGRGLVLQKIWNRRGELVATCVQEGLVRLVQGGERVKL